MMTLIQSKDVRLSQKRNAQEKWKLIADCILTNCADIDDSEVEIHYTDDTIYENMVQWMAGYVFHLLALFLKTKLWMLFICQLQVCSLRIAKICHLRSL